MRVPNFNVTYCSIDLLSEFKYYQSYVHKQGSDNIFVNKKNKTTVAFFTLLRIYFDLFASLRRFHAQD